MLSIFLFLIWMIMMNDFSDFSIIMGIIFVLFTEYITNIFFDKKIKGTVEIFISSLSTILNMYKSTITFLPLIFKKNHSGLVSYKVKNKSKSQKVAISNSITLTPGTLFVDEFDDYLLIHKIASSEEEAHSKKDVWEGELF